MGRRRRRVKGVCTYCGAPATTKDHVPPKELFAKPRPTLVTVPSCESCNAGASLDDEYFRLAVAVRHDISHPDAFSVQQAVFRSLTRPEARGLLTSFLSTLQEVEIQTPGGLYLGRGGSYEIDPPRLCKVAERTALGLFYRDFGRRLADGYHATTYLPSAFEPSARETYSRLLGPMVGTLLKREPPRFVGRGVLSYWRAITADDSDVSLWLLLFYERVAFVTMTTPPR